MTSRSNTKTRGARRMANANRRANAGRAASLVAPPGGVSETDTLDVMPPPTEAIDVMDNAEESE